MSDVESAEKHAETLAEHGMLDSRDGIVMVAYGIAIPLIEARDNAVRLAAKRELLEELERRAVSMQVDGEPFCSALQAAFDEMTAAPAAAKEKPRGE